MASVAVASLIESHFGRHCVGLDDCDTMYVVGTTQCTFQGVGRVKGPINTRVGATTVRRLVLRHDLLLFVLSLNLK